jgi:hypothetical protein
MLLSKNSRVTNRLSLTRTGYNITGRKKNKHQPPRWISTSRTICARVRVLLNPKSVSRKLLMLSLVVMKLFVRCAYLLDFKSSYCGMLSTFHFVNYQRSRLRSLFRAFKSLYSIHGGDRFLANENLIIHQDLVSPFLSNPKNPAGEFLLR